MAPQALHSLRLMSPLTGRHAVRKCSTAPLFAKRLPLFVAFPRAGSAVASCSAVQETSTGTTVSEKKDADGDKEAKPAVKSAAKPKKAPVKPLPEMMQEEIIPPLKAVLEAEDVSQVELSFQDNTLEGSFIKDDIPHYFWAFFPKGDLTVAQPIFHAFCFPSKLLNSSLRITTLGHFIIRRPHDIPRRNTSSTFV